MKYTFVFALLLVACSGDNADPGDLQRGVTADTITIGSHTDLSGAIAVWGVATTNGQRMRYEEANAAGGIHGRQIKLAVEDSQYQVPLAVKATNRLLNIDDIFLMVGSMGTPHNNAVMPRMFEAGVPNLFPLTAALSMYEPLHPMKFGYFVSYRDQARGAIAYMTEQHGFKSVCLQTLATDYGEEVAIGFEQAVAERGLEVTYVGRHKGSETDFSGTVTSIKNSGCEMLFLGPFIKDAILIYTAARNAGWAAPIVANMVPYIHEVAAAADGGMEGMYAVASFRLLDADASSNTDTRAGAWAAKYNQEYGDEPSAQAQIGYVIADLTVRALEAAGPDLSTEKFLAALEGIAHYEDPFGGPSLSFSASKHQGGDFLNLYQIVDGKWQIVIENLPY